jgi:hypothetical protein
MAPLIPFHNHRAVAEAAAAVVDELWQQLRRGAGRAGAPAVNGWVAQLLGRGG